MLGGLQAGLRGLCCGCRECPQHERLRRRALCPGDCAAAEQRHILCADRRALIPMTPGALPAPARAACCFPPEALGINGTDARACADPFHRPDLNKNAVFVTSNKVC